MIPRDIYEAYTEALDAQYAEMAQLLSDYINSFDWDVDFETAKEQRNMVIEYANTLLDVYGNACATLAADFYAETAAAEGVKVPEPAVAELAKMESVAISIRAAASALWGRERDVETFRQKSVAAMKRYAKKAANDTIMRNARRDGRAGRGVRWARVPRGAETCPFCIMLASRGFVYYSEESEELFGHEHEHCDCDVMCSFTDGGLEGYSYKEYQDEYYDNVVYDIYGHVDYDATMDGWRKSYYEDNKDRWNAMRRERYAREHPKQ